MTNTETREYPKLIKYMGSKANIIEFVSESIQSVYTSGIVCDLFSGAANLSGALGSTYPMISNDIQNYSSMLASVYLNPIKKIYVDELLHDMTINYKKAKSKLNIELGYNNFTSLEEFNEIEETNRLLINKSFKHHYHLFLKNYSGTWWSASQCMWIDAIKQAIDKNYRKVSGRNAEYALVMSTLMYAMAYCSQGTGHYGEYRSSKDVSSMKNIKIYREKVLQDIFINKLKKMIIWVEENVVKRNHSITTLDYRDCMKKLDGGTVYADPPYSYAHYSRFYHAIETLCLYDYPDLQVKGGNIVKGRYREKRHQSPFCIKTQVECAFNELFSGVKKAGSNLALSYSDMAMVKPERLVEISKGILKYEYEIWVENVDHRHMTMGRKKNGSREVKEIMLLAMKR